jgi:hypothetical protein
VLKRLSETTFDPELSAAINAYYALSASRLADILRRAIERGELPAKAKVDVAATMYIGAVKLHVIDAGTIAPLSWYKALADATIAAAAS